MSDLHVNKTRAVNNSTPTNPLSARETSQALQLRSVSSPASGSATFSFGVQEQGSETVTMVHLTAAEIKDIGAHLAAARYNAEFPATRAPEYNLEIMYQDYQRLLYLQRLRGDLDQPASKEYNAAFVEVNREIAQRDIQFREKQKDTETKRLMENIRECHNAQVREGNARQASIEAVKTAVRNGQAQNVEASVIINQISAAIQTMAGTQAHGIDGANMETVIEEVFATIEAALLDAAGPLRLNNARLDQTSTRLGNQIENMTTQVGAMNNHVSAVSNNVSALGSLIHAVNTIVNSTNTQTAQVSDQLRTLQDVIKLIPTLVEQSVQRVLADAINEAMAPSLIVALQSFAANPTVVPQQRTRRSFFGLFKRNKRGNAVAAQ